MSESIAAATEIDLRGLKSIAAGTAIDFRVLELIAVAAVIDFEVPKKRLPRPRQTIFHC